MPPVYVVLAPERIQGIYTSWEECRGKVTGVSGAQFQKVISREAAESMLRGEKHTLDPGVYAFVDGNHLGGIGVVLVHRSVSGKTARRELSTTLTRLFPTGIPLPAGGELDAHEALVAIRNIAAELGATYLAVTTVNPGTSLTLVHDYEGIEGWLTNRWRIKDAIVSVMIEEIKKQIQKRNLQVRFHHQPGHQADRLAANDWIRENRRADALAAQAGA